MNSQQYKLTVDFADVPHYTYEQKANLYRRLYSIVKQLQHTYNFKPLNSTYGNALNICPYCNKTVSNIGRYKHIHSKQHRTNILKSKCTDTEQEQFNNIKRDPNLLNQIQKYI